MIDEKQSIHISKDTRKLITDISELPNHKYEKLMNFLDALKNQQNRAN